MTDSISTPIPDSPHRRKSSRKSWCDQSPVNPMTDIAREETLLLTHFAKKPTISFGKVKVGKSLDRKLYVTNPHDYDQSVIVEKFPDKMNFAINLHQFVVPGESTLCLYLTWTPDNEGGCRQIITFLVDESYRLQTVMYGTAELPRKKKVAKRGIMSQSVKTPFAVLHTPNLANLKTYNTSTVQERVVETPHVRRALPISKSNQENLQPGTKKSSLATVKSPTPKIQNVDYQNQVKEFGVLKRRSGNRETKLKNGLEDVQYISRTSPELRQTNRNSEPVEESLIIEEYQSVENTVSRQEHVTKISSVNVWTSSVESCQVESRDEVTEMQVFDCEFRKRPKQSPENDLESLNPRRETYSVKKNMSKQRRNWRNHLSSPSVRAAISKKVMMPTTKSEEVLKSTSPTANAFNFVTSSPIGNCVPTNNTFKLEENVKRAGAISSQTNCSEFSNSKAGIDERPVMTSGTDKPYVSPKSDDGMSTDSLNSKNSSASSVEALLTSEVKKSHDVSAAVMYDFRQATPCLPEKPQPYETRRSTHVVKEPKFVCGQGKLKQKQLFSTGDAAAAASAEHDVSGVKKLDDTNDFPPPKTTQFKTVPTVRNSVSSRVRVAQKAMRMTNRDQLSQSVHERFPSSEQSAPYLTRSARSTVRSVKKTEITKSKNKNYTPKRVGIAQNRLVLGKREKTVVPKHPMPFASKNIYYDDRWMQKQEWSFTHWFNFILTPVEDYKLRNCPKVDAGSLVFNCKRDYHLAPSKEVLSFEAYAARRRLNRLRKLACKMFQSADVVKIVRKVEVEIDRQRLVVRKDRPIHADIGLKQNILNWILSYNPLWLRIGLEMVFGEVLLIESNTDILGLSKFIITRLVGNPDIEQQYAHPTVPHLYREGYQSALAKHTLKKFLILVYFLDYAKMHRLIEHDPCLLCIDSKFKASRDFLVNISRDFLSGEGDITRHLSYLGYVVNYVQTPLDEFDYAVTNLATDLRDGVRLTRVVEILTGEWGLTKMLRAPAISRLQKVHNVEKVLKALVNHGMSLDIERTKICAKDVVDGHREKTLALLWRIVTQFQVDILLDVKELEDEIACLDRSLKRKMAVWKAAGVKSDFELKSRRSSVEPTQFENSTHRLLFGWCQSVCAHYGLKIENFTVSFSDGRILCFLIHHYYPGLLPLSEVRQQTTVTYINELENQQQQDSDNSFEETASTLRCNPRTGKPLIYQELLANEAENFKLIAVKVSQIGGVPTMLRHLDMSNTIPDEKVVITYVMYLAIRLLEIRHEARAAIVIQLAWRKYQLRKRNRLLKLKSKSQTPIANYEIVTEENKTPDQSSPLRNKTPTSIKNAVLTFAEHLGDPHLGRSINDYSPIRPIDNDLLALSSKKGKVLDTILECSTITGRLNYSNISNQDQSGQYPLLNEKDPALGVGRNGQAINRNMNVFDGVQNSSKIDQSCNAYPKRDSGNIAGSESSLPSQNMVDLKDGSFVVKADLRKSNADLRNETFDSDKSNRNSLLPSELPNISSHKVSGNETFESETLFVKSDLPVVDCQRVQNKTFEKEIHSEKTASNLSLSNCDQSGHDLTFDPEVNLSTETGLLNSKADPLLGNKTFDSGTARLNALSTIEEYGDHEDEEEFEDLKTDDAESKGKCQQMVESPKKEIQEVESHDLGEILCISDESSITGRMGDHAQENEIDDESQPSNIDSFSRHNDNRITVSESNDGTEDLFNDSYVCQVQNDSVSYSRLNKTSEADKSLHNGSTLNPIENSEKDDHIRSSLEKCCRGNSSQDRLTGTSEEDDHEKFQDRLTGTSEEDDHEKFQDRLTGTSEEDDHEKFQDRLTGTSEEDDHEKFQDRLTGTSEVDDHEKSVISDSQSHRSVLDDEELTEEFVLKNSRSRRREMIVDNDGQVENEFADEDVKNGLEVSRQVNLLQESFVSVNGENKCDEAVLSNSQLPQCVTDQNEELSDEFILKMSSTRQKEMIVNNENQSRRESTSSCPIDNTIDDDRSLDDNSGSAMNRDPDVVEHVTPGLDVPRRINLLRESFSVDKDSDQDTVVLSNSQLERSVLDEDVEQTEEFVLKMSNADRKEMIVDKEERAENVSVTVSQLGETADDDRSLNDDSTSAMHHNPEDDGQVKNDHDISCCIKSLHDGSACTDVEDSYNKSALSNCQLHRSVIDDEEDEEWTEEFVVKMSRSRRKEMIVDREEEIENESVSFSRPGKTVEHDKSFSNGNLATIMHQNSEYSSDVRNRLDIPCPIDLLQDSFDVIDGENNPEKDIVADRQLQRSAIEDLTEGLTEEFLLNISRSRQREMSVENEVENESQSFSQQNKNNKNVKDMSLYNSSSSGMLQSPGDATERLTEEFLLNKSRSRQREMSVENEAEIENKSQSFSQQNKNVKDMSLYNSSSSAMLQSPGDCSNVRNNLDASCSADSVQDSFIDVNGKNNCDKSFSSDSLQPQSGEESTEELVLKMSSDSDSAPERHQNLEDNDNSVLATYRDPEIVCHVTPGLDVSRPANSLRESFASVDEESNDQNKIVEKDEEWSEEFVLKMSRSRQREMIVDKDSLDSSDDGQETVMADKSAEIIQNAFRRYKARREFLQMRNSAIAIQRWYRRTKEMRKSCEHFRSLKAATIVIQASVRRCQERKRFLRQRKCVVYLQQRRKALVAMRSTRNEYLATVAAVKAIQRWYRSIAEMRSVKEDFGKTRNAAVKIQSFVRMWICRRDFLRKKEAAVLLQIQRKKCVIALQQRRRGLLAMRKTRSEYLATVAAVKAIQRWYRSVEEMRSVKADFGKTRNSAVKIQSFVRMWSCRRKFLRNKEAAVTIQRWYQSICLMKTERTNYMSVRKATIRIQAMFRRYNQRKRFLSEKTSALLIQKTFRMFTNRKHYLAYKNSAIAIQQWYRRAKKTKEACENYKELKKATLVIQSSVRAHFARKRFLNAKRCLVLLQRRRRCLLVMRSARTEYLAKRAATKTIQRWYRAVTVMRKAKNDFQKTRMAIVKIQSVVRQRSIRKKFLRQKNSVLILQKRFRAVLLMRKQRRQYKSLRNAAVQIQACFRGQQQRKSYLLKRKSALKIQSLFRMYPSRKSYLLKRESALKLQSMFRMYQSRKSYLLKRESALKIQSLFRMYQSRKSYLLKRESALKIQSMFRMYQSRKSYFVKRESALKIQSVFRMYQTRKSYLSRLDSATTIQQWYRNAMITRKARMNFVNFRAAALVIQSNVKAYQERRRFLFKKRCVVSLQHRRRGLLAMRIARQEYLSKKQNAVVIQRWYRSVKQMTNERTLYRSKRMATVKIQSAFRGHRQRKVYLEKRKQVIVVQSVVRTWIARRNWLAMRSAAVMIQSNYRRHLARRRLRETIERRYEAAVSIQSWFRMKLLLLSQKSLFKIECDCCTSTSLMKTKKFANTWLEKTRQRKLNAVRVLQKYWREWFQRRNQAATKIQTIVRGWLVRRKLAQQKSAAVLIQKNLRAWHARVTFRKRKEATCLLQPVVRGWLVRKQVKKWNHAAACIQSFWRGYKVRCSTKGNVTTIRKRLLDAIKKVTHDKKLSSRFSMGFDYLMKYKQLSELLQALVNLEVSSRLSPVCCAQLADGNAAPIIFTIIRSCNRSVPHMELIKYSVQILLNLAKYAPTIEAVYDSQPDAIDIIFNVMTVFREKGLIFSKSCILLAIIALDMHEKGVIDRLWSRPKFKEQIMSLYKLTERKYKREESRVTTRARVVAAKDSAIFYKFSNAAAAAKARIGPDWLLGKKILREVEEPLQAVTYLLNCLNLRPETQQTSCRKTRSSK